MSPFSFTYWMMSKGASATTSTTSASSPASNVHLNLSFGINRETLITGLIVLASVAFSGFYVYIDVEKMKENAEQERLNSQRDRQVVEEENRRLKKRVLIYEGAQHALNALSIHDCEHYEGVLKASLHQIEQRKLNLLKNEIESEKGSRLCVICQESEKSVVLLPCRHLCLCDGCSNNHPTITKCPLCRKQVSDKINVFA